MTTSAIQTRRRFLAREVVQTSAMDCGPAALKCLLEGFGISASYGRLREACQTDVDGTSIDTMEEVAIQLGLEAEQIMVPVDHLLLAEAHLFPALVVVRLPNGITHFVVAWRRHGRLIQLMDPAVGRRWISGRRFLDELYVHQMPVTASEWRQWAGSEEFLTVLQARMANLRISRAASARMANAALADPAWPGVAALDAATRMVSAIVAANGIGKGRQVSRVLQSFFDRAQREALHQTPSIPEAYWSVRPAPTEAEQEAKLLLRGAVLVHVEGLRQAGRSSLAEQSPASAGQAGPFSLELVAALQESRSRPGKELLHLLRADGFLTPAVLVAALFFAAGGLVLEALLFRGLFDLGRELGLEGQRLGAILAVLGFIVGILLLELPVFAGLLRSGRRLEARLRMAFLEKLSRLNDRYFRSRLTSDMAERSHSVHWIRLLPELGGQFIRTTFELALTTVGIAWLDPSGMPVAMLAALASVGLPLAFQPILVERDLRVRTHEGALSRFYLDALLGLVPIRVHAAERAIRREHESLLVEWARASMTLQRAVVSTEGLQSLLGLILAIWLLFSYLGRAGDGSMALLLIYWALNLPFLGQQLALLARQYPYLRNVTLRLLEPLGAPEEKREGDHGKKVEMQAAGGTTRSSKGISILMEGVAVRAAGHTILEGVHLTIEGGSQVAIVGPSGAGKSSLIGILLGWHRPATGCVQVDGEPLDEQRLEVMRQEIAWVDPAIQLWNRSLLDNLCYGLPSNSSLPLGQVIGAAELRSVLERLPGGLQTPLGEGGALVSGGEGQRVRIGRAMLRTGVRLVILDEPFRGLDRQRRRELIARARTWWRDATLLCITHDVGETQAFDRVLVLEAGRIVEDGSPRALLELPGSRYKALLEAENVVKEGLWSSDNWKRLWLGGGKLVEEAQKGSP